MIKIYFPEQLVVISSGSDKTSASVIIGQRSFSDDQCRENLTKGKNSVAASPAFVSKGCFSERPSTSSWHLGLCPKWHDESSRISLPHSRNDRYHRNMSPSDTKLGKEVPVIQQAVMVLILPPPRQSFLLTQARFMKGLSRVGKQLSYQHEHDLQHQACLKC